jgi:hypothetical protein
MNMTASKFKQRGAINLVMVSFLMMVLTLAALSLLYYMRYGRVPLQDVWQRWSKSGEVVGNELKNMSGLGKDGAHSGKVATVDDGIKRCTVNGKVLFSDVECSDNNPSTRAVKLYDSKGGEPPKASANSKAQETMQGANEVDVKSQMIDKATK